MVKLLFVVILLLTISFLCSVLESVILSITRSYIQLLINKNNRAGLLLKKFKNEIEEPITAILTLNTISHTIGATVSGAFALQLFGSKWMALFSGILTLLILIFSEIIPKTLGAYYWRELGPVSAYILKFMIIVLKPIVIPVNYISKLISRENGSAGITKSELINYIQLGHMQGVIETGEFEIIKNLFQLNSINVKDIMTSRTVVFWLPPDKTIKTIIKDNTKLQFSRIPLYKPGDNSIEGIVLRRDIMDNITKKRTSVKLIDISSKPQFIIETVSVYNLLDKLISNKSHIAIVLNEYGDYRGIVTMEDAIETLLGREIVDEFDTVEDMSKLARIKYLKKYGKSNRDKKKD